MPASGHRALRVALDYRRLSVYVGGTFSKNNARLHSFSRPTAVD
jgi:hypothetical protein